MGLRLFGRNGKLAGGAPGGHCGPIRGRSGGLSLSGPRGRKPFPRSRTMNGINYHAKAEHFATPPSRAAYSAAIALCPADREAWEERAARNDGDRASAVEGKGVAEHINLGGRR